jgi:predicted O-methyltransferase YrrM
MKNVNYDLIWEECKKYRIQQKYNEFIPLLKIANELEINRTTKNILEIGSCYGGTTKGFSYICDNLVTMDYNPQFNYKEMIHEGCNIYQITGNTHLNETSDQLIKIDIPPFDIIFIDGDHTYEGCKSDFERYKGYLSKAGGLIAFHDIQDNWHHRVQNCNVGRFWNEIKQNYKYEEFVETWGENEWGGIGVLKIC